jgi:hypothetical protein
MPDRFTLGRCGLYGEKSNILCLSGIELRFLGSPIIAVPFIRVKISRNIKGGQVCDGIIFIPILIKYDQDLENCYVYMGIQIHAAGYIWDS